MITGATGCGKSSTINALFNIDSTNYTERAKVGVTPDPETMSIERYELDNLVLWDSPVLVTARSRQQSCQKHHQKAERTR